MISGNGALYVGKEKVADLTAIDEEWLGEIVSFKAHLLPNFSFCWLYKEVFEAKQTVDVEFAVGQHRYISKGYIYSVGAPDENGVFEFDLYPIHKL